MLVMQKSDSRGYAANLDTLAELFGHARNLLCNDTLLHLLLIQAWPHQLTISHLPEEHAKRIHIAGLGDVPLAIHWAFSPGA